MDFIGMCLDAAGDGIEARLKLPEILEKGFERDTGLGYFAVEVANFEIGKECLAERFGADR